MKISDKYSDIDDFEEILSSAGENADNGWETDFVNGIQERFEKYGVSMFLSEKQDEILNRIAEGE